MRIFPLGDSALTIELGNEISSELNARAINLADKITDDAFPGLIEAVPAYSSVSVFFDPVAVRRSLQQFPTAFAAVSELVRATANDTTNTFQIDTLGIEIPVAFDEQSSPDLSRVSELSGMSGDEVIELFLSRKYSVYMLGFLPGFAYMGNVDERIATPRLDVPRKIVPKGSVGIAGQQTGVYPLESPGGWNIIGRTTMEMFDPESERPCRLRPGDIVKFVRALP